MSTNAGEKTRQEAPDVREISEVGALTEWWNQLRTGHRSTCTVDALRHAAILEAQARDAVTLGQRGAANRDRLRAASLLVLAAGKVSP